jgi:hypothetical protein
MNPDYPEFDYMEIVWQIRQVVRDPDPEYFVKVFSLTSEGIVAKFATPHQETLLHRLVQTECELVFRSVLGNYGEDKLQEYLSFYLESPLDAEVVRRVLSTWREKLFAMWNRKLNADEDLSTISLDGETLPSLLPLAPLVDQIFFILFTDRLFLFQFNDVLSKIVPFLKDFGFSQYLTKNGTIRRLNYIPKWLEKGIFKRDQGYCVQCERNLMGVKTIEEIHYDHIVPLAQYGCNDPVNFQLFCKECNLRKGKKKWLPPENALHFW